MQLSLSGLANRKSAFPCPLHVDPSHRVTLEVAFITHCACHVFFPVSPMEAHAWCVIYPRGSCYSPPAASQIPSKGLLEVLLFQEGRLGCLEIERASSDERSTMAKGMHP